MKILDNTQFWNNCLAYISEQIPEQAYQTWFDIVEISTMTNEEIVLQVPNKFHYEWLDDKYRHLIDAAIKENLGHPLVVNYSIVVSNKSVDEIPSLIPKEKPISLNYQKKSQLNARYNFENFIEGGGNQLAKAAAYSIGETPGQTPFNPLVLYSETGLGKTHLLQAIGNYTEKMNPSLRVLYLTSEKFLQDFISAIQKNKSADFAANYRNIDMLLIDDVQFFQNKDSTQEQFFHLFNELYQQGKQIVLTTDRHPSELNGLKDRLISRFQSGLIVDIQPPDFETRIAILMKKAEEDGLELPYNITEFIASSVKNNIRQLEGTLIRLLALSSLRKQDITMNLVKNVLKDILGKAAYVEVTIDHVVKYVSKILKVSEKQLLGKGRTMEVALARQTAMYLSRELANSSLLNIGMHLGGRDHSTVIHACRNIEKKMKNDSEFKNRIDKMKKELSPIG
jgi:chromosomal replication initiator protein